MAFDTKELIKSAIKILNKDDSLIFIDDLCVHLGISRQTYYDHELDKVDVIKQHMLKNKVSIKKELRNKWMKTENATTEIFLYKLAANQEELNKVNNVSTVNITNEKKEEKKDFTKLSKEELATLQGLEEKLIDSDE